MPLRCTLLADGPSDRVLLEILGWLLPQHGVVQPRLYFFSEVDLATRLREGSLRFPADLFLVHRDAENQSGQLRREEILGAVEGTPLEEPTVAVVPVRMTEAWFLIDEPALREASGNRRSRVQLEHWPEVSRLERLPDPKHLAFALLKQASELKGRKLHRFDSRDALRRLAGLITDYSPLRRLPAFTAFETDLVMALQSLGYGGDQ